MSFRLIRINFNEILQVHCKLILLNVSLNTSLTSYLIGLTVNMNFSSYIFHILYFFQTTKKSTEVQNLGSDLAATTAGPELCRPDKQCLIVLTILYTS